MPQAVLERGPVRRPDARVAVVDLDAPTVVLPVAAPTRRCRPRVGTVIAVVVLVAAGVLLVLAPTIARSVAPVATGPTSGWTPLGCEITAMSPDHRMTPASRVSPDCTVDALISRACGTEMQNFPPQTVDAGGRRISIWLKGEVVLSRTPDQWRLTCWNTDHTAVRFLSLDAGEIAALESPAALPRDLDRKIDNS